MPQAGKRQREKRRKLNNKVKAFTHKSMSAFFIEDEDGKSVRCEYRSDGTRNVQSIAKKFNGGGHFAASGGTFILWKI